MISTTRNKAFISNVVACTLTAVFCFAVSSFAVVWQYQSNVRIAKDNVSRENATASLFRQQTEIAKRIADQQTFEALARRNEAFGLKLAAIRERQLVRVTIDPLRRLDMKRNTERIGFLPAAPATNVSLLARPALDIAPDTIRFAGFTR